MRNVYRSASALLVLGVVLAGCSYSNDSNDTGDKAIQTSPSELSANEVVLNIPGMT